MNASREPEIVRDIGEFKIQGLAIPYPEFVPRLYNLCLSLGFRRGYIMPSRAFCSDENQGFPIILLTKHFGTFPFNHGRVGGIIATDRHGPHAHHGEDSVIVQASHVGYDPKTGIYGTCERPKTEGNCSTPSCGKITHAIAPYLEQYQFAQKRIFLSRDTDGRCLITAKDSFIDFASKPVTDGLVLRLRDIARINGDGRIVPVATHSTSIPTRSPTASGNVWRKTAMFGRAGPGRRWGICCPPIFSISAKTSTRRTNRSCSSAT